MKSLANQVALVTGAGSGIGRATAVALAQAGCIVVCNDIQPCQLEETADRVTRFGPVLPLCGDVTDADQVTQMCDTAVAEFGQIDILINNAGMAMGGFIDTVPVAEWQKLMQLNFWAYVYTTQAILPQMLARKRGHLVYISSISGLLTSPNSLPYGTSKFAVTALAESVAQHVRSEGIGVSLVCPSTTQTDIAGHGRYFFASQSESTLAKSWFQSAVKNGLPAEVVAQKILSAIQKDRFLVLTHWYTRPMMVFRTLFPGSFIKLSCLFHSREIAKAQTMSPPEDRP